MLTTQQARDAWGPPCKGARSTVALYGSGFVSVRTEIVPAVEALSDCLRVAGYLTRKDDTGAYNCRKITGGTGYSLHAYGIAVDVNWETNPYGDVLVTDMPASMVADIKAIRTANGKQVWRWGGDYSGNKDAMHFEVVCTPADLASGFGHEEDDVTPDQWAFIEAMNAKLDGIAGSLDKIVAQKPTSSGAPGKVKVSGTLDVTG